MTTEMTPRSPGRRMTASVLAVPVAALGIVLLPPNTCGRASGRQSTGEELSVNIATSEANGSLGLRWGNTYMRRDDL